MTKRTNLTNIFCWKNHFRELLSLNKSINITMNHTPCPNKSQFISDSSKKKSFKSDHFCRSSVIKKKKNLGTPCTSEFFLFDIKWFPIIQRGQKNSLWKPYLIKPYKMSTTCITSHGRYPIDGVWCIRNPWPLFWSVLQVISLNEEQ